MLLGCDLQGKALLASRIETLRNCCYGSRLLRPSTCAVGSCSSNGFGNEHPFVARCFNGSRHFFTQPGSGKAAREGNGATPSTARTGPTPPWKAVPKSWRDLHLYVARSLYVAARLLPRVSGGRPSCFQDSAVVPPQGRFRPRRSAVKSDGPDETEERERTALARPLRRRGMAMNSEAAGWRPGSVAMSAVRRSLVGLAVDAVTSLWPQHTSAVHGQSVTALGPLILRGTVRISRCGPC